jgi:hypothetical protein
MEEEFYATIKLTSGEEIVAKVSYDPNDDVIILLDPRLIEKVEQKKGNHIIEGIVFDDWINATYENMFIIPRSQIITMIELDERIASFYEDHLNDKSKYKKRKTEEPKSNNKRQNPKNHEGYLGSIKEAKKLLEEIYNKS